MEQYVLTHGSYLAIFVLLALTGAGLPLPEEVVIIAAGILSSPNVGRMDPIFALLACLGGAVLGDCAMYGVGRGLGRSFLKRHKWFARVIHAEREAKMERIVQRHGFKVFLIARFLVGLRAPIHFAMGILRVGFARYLIFDAICAGLVVNVFFWLSFFFGGWIGQRLRESQLAITAFALILGLMLGAYYIVANRFRRELPLDDSAQDRGAPIDPS